MKSALYSECVQVSAVTPAKPHSSHKALAPCRASPGFTMSFKFLRSPLVPSALSVCDKDYLAVSDTLSLIRGRALLIGPCWHHRGKVILYKHCLPKSRF